MWGIGRSRGSALKGWAVRVALFALILSHVIGPGSSKVVAQDRHFLPQETTSLTAHGTARPTPAAREFCRRHRSECQVDSSEPEVIDLTASKWLEITAVNQQVNASILAVPDEEHWAVVDRWDYPTDGKGDCEDIQLLKRKLLAERGIPRRAMPMVMVLDEEGAGHAVLMIRTNRGEFILDNRRDGVLPWSRTGYTFVKREQPGTSAWVSLHNQRGQVIIAQR
jgi:predicted transglutaminase-like cysteine proteinase